MTNGGYILLKAQLAVLREVVTEYGGKTIENIIQQMDARVKETEE